MNKPTRRLSVNEASVQFFRDCRAHLVGAGARDLSAAARAILGAQSQQEAPGLFALSLRTRGRPTAAQAREELFENRPPRLVRTWAQRDTVHILDPEDWRRVVAARGEWPQSGRRGALPSEPDLELVRARFEGAGQPLSRADIFDIIPQRFVDEVAKHPGVWGTGTSARRFAASRLIWRLALAGDLCFGEKRGSEQSYAHRSLWFPDLRWGELVDAQAATELARRYLKVHGPATPRDLAHFFGARVSSARMWLERLEPETAELECGARVGLIVLREDLKSLRQPAPKGLREWPVRLLPKWDTHLMRHADKSWLVPDEAERPLVWRKAADVSASVVARGRIVATWSHRATKTSVRVSVKPLGAWRKQHLAGVEREATAFAAYLEVPRAEVEVEA